MKNVLLVILDGFGLRSIEDFNAVSNAKMPNWQHYTKKYAFGAIDASGLAVGLPAGQFGNSEVGHLNIGAGRIVLQDITRIDAAIADGEFFNNPAFIQAIDSNKSGTLHIMGLLSDGGVHAQISHILALIKLANMHSKITQVWVHVFCDGRDTPPRSVKIYIKELQEYIKQYANTHIATCSGRYYAMDRDKRYDRLATAYNAIALGQSNWRSVDIDTAVADEYANGINDEFIHPYVLGDYSGFSDGDSVIFANFRSDRAIQLTDALISNEFSGFERTKVNLAALVTMTNYDPKFNVLVAFAKQTIANTLGECLANLGIKQLRISETEKYPHVTYFFNGGRKEPFALEERILVDSPRDVATYDLKPEMSLPVVAKKLVEAIKSEQYKFIITNFANGDMVGHSGNFKAAIAAVEAIDRALGEVIPCALEAHYEILIIADHGNCEEMYDYEAKQPHTQHTTNLVPCLYIGRNATICEGGALKDVAPTLLAIAGLKPPAEMSGTNLIEFADGL